MWNWPDGQGLDLCLQIRALSACRDVPIVMVTGKHDTASIGRAYEVGATDFISKPVLWPTPCRIGLNSYCGHAERAARQRAQEFGDVPNFA